MPANIYQFPSPIRDEVLKTLEGEPNETRKLLSCRPNSRCRSIFCPSCSKLAGYEKKDALYRAALHVDKARLKFGTFKALDVPVEALRSTVQRLMAAGRKMLKTLKLDGHALSIETSVEDWHDGYHCHAHALVDAPLGGRRFIPQDAWNDAWLTALPADLHPTELVGAAHVKPVRDVEAVCYYLSKSPFFKLVAEREAVTKTITAIDAMKRLHRYECRGSLGDTGETARCAL